MSLETLKTDSFTVNTEKYGTVTLSVVGRVEEITDDEGNTISENAAVEGECGGGYRSFDAILRHNENTPTLTLYEQTPDGKRDLDVSIS